MTLSSPAMTHSDEGSGQDRLIRSLRASTVTIFLFFGGFCGWLFLAPLDSAAIAPGLIENAASTKTVQHLEGGIVTRIAVRNGDKVEAGDLLLRLDPTRSAASADLFTTQLWSARARKARLQAEIHLSPKVPFDDAILAAAQAYPEVLVALKDERAQFEIARGTLLQEADLLQNQIGQAKVENEGHSLRDQIAREELALVEADLGSLETLRGQGLVNQSKVTDLKRDRLSLKEKIAQSGIEIARNNQLIMGLELRIAQSRETYRQRASELMDQTSREIRSLERDATVAVDTLRRIDMRAPVSGTVQESILGTIGAVIAPGETIMKIVPGADDLVISAKVSPNDIETILPGMRAEITFPAFQSIEMRPATGRLTVISRDRVVNRATDEEYYEAEIKLDETTIPDEIRGRLVAGMAASVALPTGVRSALSYLVSPLMRRVRAAMREE